MTSRRASAFVVMLSVTALVLAGLGQRSADATHMTVTEVEGSAFGCEASVSLFGGPPGTVGPIATAEIPPTGGSDLETVPECRVTFGPATIFTSGPITVTSEGTTGPTGSVTSTATVGPINTSGQEVFTAAGATSTCTANEDGVTGSTTITGGTLVVSEGNPDVEGDETVVTIPTNPAPNTTYEGTIESVGDNFRAVFNEQIVNPDGSLTVNAYHLYLLGPTAVGDVIVGQVVCGVTTVAQETTTTTVPEETTTTTVPEETTTTTVPEETTTTTVPEETTTTTIPEETTTTTVPEETTTTTVPQETTTTTVPQETTTTTVPQQTTTTTVPQQTTTTTTVGAACVPFQDNARPGYGHGDQNHRHCGPPGQTGDRPPGGKSEQGLNGRPVSNSGNLPPAWLLAGLGLLFLAPLVVPFGRSRRGDRRA